MLSAIESEDPDSRQKIIVDASYIKVHQDATRSPLSAEEQKLGKTKGGRNTKISASVNSRGKLLKAALVCGNEHDSQSFECVLPERIQGCDILADKAYDTDAIRLFIKERGARAAIPPQKNRKQPIHYDKEVGKSRHLVENFFCRIKRFRRVNTRHEQSPKNYIGFVTIAAIADWIIS